jgi:hypothetical protein
MAALNKALGESSQEQRSYLGRLAAGFKPPSLPPISRRAFRFHIAFTVLYAIFEGVLANAPLMAVKAMNASDIQLQLPLAMASFGLFFSVLLGTAMARWRKKPFVVVPGFASAAAALMMAWMPTAGWFLFMAGMVSIGDFSMRPAVPSIIRIIYPNQCRSHVSGTMRQYGSIAFLFAVLASAALLSLSSHDVVHFTVRLEITLAGLACVAAFLFFLRLPETGNGSVAEAVPLDDRSAGFVRASLKPLLDRRFRRYLAAVFVFSFANLFHQGVVPAFFARDLGMGYVEATVLIHMVPNLTAFLGGGFLTSWFESASVWRSYALVTCLWGLDPVILATASSLWPMLVFARMLRGPATLGSMVIAFFTGVHSFTDPGTATSRYMAVQLFVNGVARLLAPMAASLALGYISRRAIILYGGLGVLASSVMFWWSDWRESAVAQLREERVAGNA